LGSRGGAVDVRASDDLWFDQKEAGAEGAVDPNSLVDKIKTYNNSSRLQPERHAYKSQMSKHQEEIMSSIETLNYSLFVDLGGTTNVNLNFYSQIGDSIVYPIMSAAAKGSKEMIELCLMNKTMDIQVVNNLGVNAFWVACMYGHGVAMRILAEAGIYLFCTN
jgi:ankyrin repeat protein